MRASNLSTFDDSPSSRSARFLPVSARRNSSLLRAAPALARVVVFVLVEARGLGARSEERQHVALSASFLSPASSCPTARRRPASRRERAQSSPMSPVSSSSSVSACRAVERRRAAAASRSPVGRGAASASRLRRASHGGPGRTPMQPPRCARATSCWWASVGACSPTVLCKSRTSTRLFQIET